MAAPDAPSPPAMISPPALIIVSDSLFLDQDAAHRGALRTIAADLARQAGGPPERTAVRDLPDTGISPARTAELCAGYLAERRRLSRVPEGLAEGLAAVKRRAGARHADAPLVGISPLPAASLAGYLAESGLETVMDRVYGAADGSPPGWIRGIETGDGWPSATALRGIAALHHCQPRHCLLLAADELREPPLARRLGMRCLVPPPGGPAENRFARLPDQIHPVRLNGTRQRDGR